MIKQQTLDLLSAIPLIAWAVGIIWLMCKERRNRFSDTSTIAMYFILGVVADLCVFGVLVRALDLIAK